MRNYLHKNFINYLKKVFIIKIFVIFVTLKNLIIKQN